MSNGNNTVTYRNFRNFDRQSFRNDISFQSWDSVNAFFDPNEMWQEWKHAFLAIANKHAPLRTKRVRARISPWITSRIKGLMHTRDILKIKAIMLNAPTDWMLYKRQRNLTNKEIRLTKQGYYQNSFKEHTDDSRKTWQTINELTAGKSGKTSVTSLKVIKWIDDHQYRRDIKRV